MKALPILRDGVLIVLAVFVILAAGLTGFQG